MNCLLSFFLGILVATTYERKGWKGLIGMRWPFKIALVSIIALWIFILTQKP